MQRYRLYVIIWLYSSLTIVANLFPLAIPLISAIGRRGVKVGIKAFRKVRKKRKTRTKSRSFRRKTSRRSRKSKRSRSAPKRRSTSRRPARQPVYYDDYYGGDDYDDYYDGGDEWLDEEEDDLGGVGDYWDDQEDVWDDQADQWDDLDDESYW